MGHFEREFSILGQKIVIKDQGEAELAALAVRIVNEKVAEIQTKKPLMGPNQVAVLALLEIAGNMVKDRQAIDEYREELDRKCTVLMTEITRMPVETTESTQQFA
jgi:cell division protein ZapA (FtsZ GTPase activity inhibitor)